MTDPAVRESIMTATYEALCTRGYTDLTAQDIADRTDKSKSLLFYHYDSKEELIADFIDYLLDRYEERATEATGLSPVERLAVFVDWFLYSPEDEARTSFHAAMLELRTRARSVDEYRDRLRRTDDQLRGTLESILRDGIEEGQFVEHDPEETAALLIAAFDGARIRQLTIGRDEYLTEVRSAAVTRVIDELLAEGVAFPDEPPSMDDVSLEATLDLENEPDDGVETADETEGEYDEPGSTDGGESLDEGDRPIVEPDERA